MSESGNGCGFCAFRENASNTTRPQAFNHFAAYYARTYYHGCGCKMSFGNLFLWRVTLGCLFGLFTFYLPYAQLTPSQGLATSLSFRAILAALTLACVIAAVVGPLRKNSGAAATTVDPATPGSMSESDIDTMIARYASHPVDRRHGPIEPRKVTLPRRESGADGQTERRSGFGRRGTDRRE